MGFRIIIVTFAMLIDGLEMAVETAMTAIGSTAGGAVAGCALGAQYAGKIGCTLGGLAGGVVGFLIQGTPLGPMIGALLGYILNIGITFMFGSVLVLFLIFARKFKPGATVGIFILKLIPVLGVAPGWTWYAWHSTGEKKVLLDAGRAKADSATNGYTTTPEARERQMHALSFNDIRRPNEQTA